jgi:uncharacterized protein (TIGR01244 family)
VTIRTMLPMAAAMALAAAALACENTRPPADTGATAATAEQPADAPLPGAANYSRVDATVACGGATPADSLPHLREMGFNAVINLRQADESGAEIETARRTAEDAGLRYVHIPMNGSNPQPETADAFLAAVQDPANSPVYIHCGTANRVGAMWLIKRVVVDGWDVDRATQEARQIGLRSPQLEQFALDYIKTRRG